MKLRYQICDISEKLSFRDIKLS